MCSLKLFQSISDLKSCTIYLDDRSQKFEFLYLLLVQYYVFQVCGASHIEACKREFQRCKREERLRRDGGDESKAQRLSNGWEQVLGPLFPALSVGGERVTVHSYCGRHLGLGLGLVVPERQHEEIGGYNDRHQKSIQETRAHTRLNQAISKSQHVDITWRHRGSYTPATTRRQLPFDTPVSNLKHRIIAHGVCTKVKHKYKMRTTENLEGGNRELGTRQDAIPHVPADLCL
ncbi:hypothetical protein KQX54_005992 [Cotesia glomerata]|uniref:Uncharacterized protein n=1 Tax=Cotesia glomerata TaxID=32391 RepID=A0AAV7ISA3_COTGL|nr:hypothetical protein KQX54_005992 [Cotesia glomerata]